MARKIPRITPFTRWGRGQETYGEDPILTKKLLMAFIDGLQNGAQTQNALGERLYETIATCKHFVVRLRSLVHLSSPHAYTGLELACVVVVVLVVLVMVVVVRAVVVTSW